MSLEDDLRGQAHADVQGHEGQGNLWARSKRTVPQAQGIFVKAAGPETTLQLVGIRPDKSWTCSFEASWFRQEAMILWNTNTLWATAPVEVVLEALQPERWKISMEVRTQTKKA